jgi:type IV pilus assembly protein PilA
MFKTKYPVFKCFQKHQKGFTLIEILVAIAILGLIAAVALPNIIAFMDSGETEAKAAELHNVQVAASAAVYAGNSTCVEEPSDSTGIIEALPDGPADKIGTYLINDTTWEYIVTDIGVVERDE